MKDALRVLGFTPEEIDQLFNVVGAVLHLGNVSFNSEHDLAKVAPGDSIGIVAEVRLQKMFFLSVSLIDKLLNLFTSTPDDES